MSQRMEVTPTMRSLIGHVAALTVGIASAIAFLVGSTPGAWKVWALFVVYGVGAWALGAKTLADLYHSENPPRP